jgi:hypothetical protein
MPTIVGATTTAQTVLNSVSQDIRKQLDSQGTDATILLDYLSRVQLDLLRLTRWEFLSAPKQRFVTQLGVTDYWIGSAGAAPAGTYDTNLNLTDYEFIRKDSVIDRTNDKSFYQPVPLAPLVTTAFGGSLGARTYYVKQTLVDSNSGESTPSATEAVIFVPASRLLQVNAPQPLLTQSASGIKYNQYRVYASTTSGAQTLQGATTAITANWLEPTTGLTTNLAVPPTVNNIEQVRGYVIEFGYYRQRQAVTLLSQVLQIPDEYFDVVVAGVNFYAFLYLIEDIARAQTWQRIYSNGQTGMIRDKYQFPAGAEFIKPDPASQLVGFTYGR